MEKMRNPPVEAFRQRLGQQAGVHAAFLGGDELHCRQLPCEPLFPVYRQENGPEQ